MTRTLIAIPRARVGTWNGELDQHGRLFGIPRGGAF
jgi:hypothetical protein